MCWCSCLGSFLGSFFAGRLLWTPFDSLPVHNRLKAQKNMEWKTSSTRLPFYIDIGKCFSYNSSNQNAVKCNKITWRSYIEKAKASGECIFRMELLQNILGWSILIWRENLYSALRSTPLVLAHTTVNRSVKYCNPSCIQLLLSWRSDFTSF